MPPSDSARLLESIWGTYAPTPLQEVPELARRAGCARVLLKREDRRELGNFKSLGGTIAGLRALADVAGDSVAAVLARRDSRLPALLCASDGNHGLAVATAASRAGTTSRIFLHQEVDAARVGRIVAAGGRVETVAGTYDDAVEAAAGAALAGQGILVPDTSFRTDERVLAHVMQGYQIIAEEIRAQLDDRPTHLFVQAGVGGLAAAMSTGLAGAMASPARICVVEPASAACVAAGLQAGRAVRVPGRLSTSADMLSCGQASTPALATLIAHGAQSIVLAEEFLQSAIPTLCACGGPVSSASGTAGIAGLLRVAEDVHLRRRHGLGPQSVVLCLLTEGPAPG